VNIIVGGMGTLPQIIVLNQNGFIYDQIGPVTPKGITALYDEANQRQEGNGRQRFPYEQKKNFPRRIGGRKGVVLLRVGGQRGPVLHLMEDVHELVAGDGLVLIEVLGQRVQLGGVVL